MVCNPVATGSPWSRLSCPRPVALRRGGNGQADKGVSFPVVLAQGEESERGVVSVDGCRGPAVDAGHRGRGSQRGRASTVLGVSVWNTAGGTAGE